VTAISDKPALRTAVYALGAATLLAFVVYAANMLLGFASPERDFLIREWFYNFMTGSAAVVTFAVALTRREGRLPWTLIGFGLLLWAVSDVYWTAFLATMDSPPFPSVPDGGYLTGYVFVMLGVAGLARARVARMRTIEWFDVAIGTLSVAVLGIALLLDYVLANTSGTPLEVGVALGYPILDLMILAAAVAAVALTGWQPGRGLALVCAGVCIVGIGDAVYTYQSLAGTYDAAAWNNLLWPIGVSVMAFASLQPSPRTRMVVRPEGWRAFASPVIFSLVIFALLVLSRLDEHSALLDALTAVTLAAIVIRIALTFNENRRLVTLLKQDSLTQLGNRSKLMLDLQRLYEERSGGFVLTVLDLDGFKAYNDAFGHPAGDAVLTRLGRQLAETVGDEGSAYRLGGDEFAVLVPGDLAASAELVARSTRALSDHGEGFQIGSSAGSAELPREARDPATAIQLADLRMYEDKDTRRPAPGREVEDVLIRIIQHRSPGLGAHGASVASIATAAAKRLGMTDSERIAVRRAAELHDIGKIAIPDAILQKPGPLTPEEWEFMRQHTILGERILSAAPSLAALGKVVRATHERWDGAGYPDGLAGEEIPFAARIIFAADAYDAITTARPYARQKTPGEALLELRRCSGTWFDPGVVDAVIEAATEVRAGESGQPGGGVDADQIGKALLKQGTSF
jgi:two-component system, cell cycle response regulator